MNVNGIDPEKLLELIKPRRALYDFKMREYSCKPIVDKLWAEVAAQLDSTVAECKAKWTCLRSSYARSRRDLRKLSQSGYGFSNKRKKTWYLTDSMAFLSDFMMHHSKRDDSEEMTLDDSWCPNNGNEDSTHSGDNSEEVFTDNTDKHLKHPFDNDHKITEPMVEISEANEFTDPDLLFFRSLIPDFKKLPNKKKRQFKEMVLISLNKALDEEDDHTLHRNGITPKSNPMIRIKQENDHQRVDA